MKLIDFSIVFYKSSLRCLKLSKRKYIFNISYECCTKKKEVEITIFGLCDLVICRLYLFFSLSVF